MNLFRPYLFPLAVCLVIEALIYHGLFALGASEEMVVELEMIWLCIAVFITLIVGERFQRK